MKKYFQSTVPAFQSLCHDRFWQQVLWSEVRTLDLLRAPPGLLGAPGFTSDGYNNNAYEVTIQSPIGCEKQQHLSTSPSNHVIALSSSPYRFPWFGQHFRPYDLSCKGFCMTSPVCMYIIPIGIFLTYWLGMSKNWKIFKRCSKAPALLKLGHLSLGTSLRQFTRETARFQRCTFHDSENN